MTLLQAFKSGSEFGYTNDNLYNKILIDRGLTSTTTYAQSYRDDIDLCLIDLYTYLKTHPEIQDGNTRIKYDQTALGNAIRQLAARHHLSTTDQYSIGLGPNVSGEARW